MKKGNFYQHADGTLYMLTLTGSGYKEMALVSINGTFFDGAPNTDGGNYWSEPIEVEDSEKLQEREWDEITGWKDKQFKEVKVQITIL